MTWLVATWFGVKDQDQNPNAAVRGWSSGACALGGVDGIGVEEGEHGGVGVGEGEQGRRAVIVWGGGGRLPEQNPTPLTAR